MRELLLDFGDSETPGGFRLQRMEVLNWGTFHDSVWSLRLEGENGLLTGDIGSGKSTLVDGLTTLLVPAQRVAYNRAAGASLRERDLRSYVLGAYRSERGDEGGSARPVALREEGEISALLGVFGNAATGQTVSLLQVFWVKEGQGQPVRFYGVADRDLGIREDLSGRRDVLALKRHLRSLPGVEIFDAFPPYGAAFRRRFGIEGEQPLDLFHQAVSLKSVGNLTDFVRSHMLEPFPVLERIQALIGHFEDLTRAHEAVLVAKDQIQRLAPLVDHLDRRRTLLTGLEELRVCREALHPYMMGLKEELLDRRLEELNRETEQIRGKILVLEERCGTLRARRDELIAHIAADGGDRLEALRRQIRELEAERERRRRRCVQYEDLCGSLGLPGPSAPEVFEENRRRGRVLAQEVRQQEEGLQDREGNLRSALQEGRRRREALEEELGSLKGRRSNIEARQVALRSSLVRALNLSEEDLPFVGELVRVQEDQRRWEGAAERLLRGFALSLLVPDLHYPAVSAWVDRTHLKGRLVYFRVRPLRGSRREDLSPDALVCKLEVHPGPFAPWLEQELAERFDHRCCEDLERFRRETRALTLQGQIKVSGERHEKDDRFRLDDRSRYVLGWSNAEKIAELERARAQEEGDLEALEEERLRVRRDLETLRDRGRTLGGLEHFGEFRDLDWRAPEEQAARLREEWAALEAASDRRRLLQHQREETERDLGKAERTLQERRDEASRTEERIAQAEARRAEARDAGRVSPEVRGVFPRLEALRREIFPDRALTPETCEAREREIREVLTGRIDGESAKVARLERQVVVDMRAFLDAYPHQAQEVDDRIEAEPAYRRILGVLQGDDLPRFESRFKELLNENTLREVLNFQAQLLREQRLIRERIARINESLAQIDYNEGRYIVLELQDTPDREVRDFIRELRECTEGTLAAEEGLPYAEGKFSQVRRILERFRGREGQGEGDRRWTEKVTDVRNGFVFSASERWREDHQPFEHYTDSGGKSGGQKEKLAYTILAASLAYQYGLDRRDARTRTFRLVVIDEAFGRGSDESARYALCLFQRLGLQILVVTPLQKIPVIEPFVAQVGFVHNDREGKCSMLRNLTIQEYQREKEGRT